MKGWQWPTLENPVKLNYVENRNGRRVIRWTNLCVFFVAALLTSAASGWAYTLFRGGDATSSAFHGVVLGFAVFVGSLVYSLLLPVDSLPRGA